MTDQNSDSSPDGSDDKNANQSPKQSPKQSNDSQIILLEEGETYKICLEGFEGPLDLLLHLIRKHKLDIYDIPIAKILEEYLKTLDVMRELNLDVAGEFLVMAATLAEIKSRMLLPTPEDEEEEEGEDPRAELVRRLIEYERMREAARQLEERPLLGREVFARTWRSPDIDEAAPEASLLELDLFQLLVAFKEALDNAPEEIVHEVTRERLSAKDVMEEILSAFEDLPEGMSLSFWDLFPPRPTKDRIVATFLAILELVRLRAIRVVQAAAFGELRIYSVPGS